MRLTRAPLWRAPPSHLERENHSKYSTAPNFLFFRARAAQSIHCVFAPGLTTVLCWDPLNVVPRLSSLQRPHRPRRVRWWTTTSMPAKARHELISLPNFDNFLAATGHRHIVLFSLFIRSLLLLLSIHEWKSHLPAPLPWTSHRGTSHRGTSHRGTSHRGPSLGCSVIFLPLNS